MRYIILDICYKILGERISQMSPRSFGGRFPQIINIFRVNLPNMHHPCSIGVIQYYPETGEMNSGLFYSQ